MRLRHIAALLLPLLLTGRTQPRQSCRDFGLVPPIPEHDVLVIGFMGGRDRWDDDRVGVGRFANHLRRMQIPGLHVVTVENRKRELALHLVRQAFDRNHDARLDDQERASIRLVLFGQSFGGAAVVKFARQLKNIGAPVLLTVQVDSIGLNDETIPSNVAAAASLFQRDGYFIRGPQEIRAEDPRATNIIGNFQYRYRDSNIDISHLPWYKTIFRRAHARMDRDPEVWGKVEELVLSAVRKATLR